MEEIKIDLTDQKAVKKTGMCKAKIAKTILVVTMMTISLLASNPSLASNIRDLAGLNTPTDSTDRKTRYVFFGLSYGSNSYYLGRYQQEVLPYLSADVSYKSKSGLWLSAIAYDIRHSITSIDEVDLMAGWTFDFSDRVDGSLFYTRFIFTESTELIKASVDNVGTASLGVDWSILYTKLTGHYIFGDTRDFFLQIENSRYFETGRVFGKEDFISMDPKLTITSGTQTFVDTYYVNRGSPLINRPGNGRPGWVPGQGTTSPVAVESETERFAVMSFDLSLPVAYNTGNFSFEINSRYLIPVNLLEGDTSTPQFFFTAGIVYFIAGR